MHQHLHSHSHKKRNKWIPSILLAAIAIFGYFNLSPSHYSGQDFFTAHIDEIISEVETTDDFFDGITQTVQITSLSGPEKGTQIQIEHLTLNSNSSQLKLEKGQKVIVQNFQAEYIIVDKYRLTPLILILILFFLTALAFTGIEAVYSFLALAASFVILIQFIVNFILQGFSPFWVTIAGSLMIVSISTFLAHGFKKRTQIAVLGTIITLGVASIISVIAVKITRLAGLGSDEAFALQLGSTNINLQGILLAGIIIGTLGVLDDITTSQAAAVDEISKANPKLSSTELYKRGLSVGKEHIASLINTLVLAYAGAAMPLFVLFVSENASPAWILINSESIAEELIQMLVGSTALVLSVPITTMLAARFLKK